MRTSQPRRPWQLVLLWGSVTLLLLFQTAIVIHHLHREQRLFLWRPFQTVINHFARSSSGSPDSSFGKPEVTGRGTFVGLHQDARSQIAGSPRSSDTDSSPGGTSLDGEVARPTTHPTIPLSPEIESHRKKVLAALSHQHRSKQLWHRGQAGGKTEKNKLTDDNSLPQKPAPNSEKDLVVPLKLKGSAKRGEHIFRQGCSLCHGKTAKAISTSYFNPKGWSTFFASGKHGRHTPFEPHFTRSELVDVKAYVMFVAAHPRKKGSAP